MKNPRQSIVARAATLMCRIAFAACLFSSAAIFAQTLQPSPNGRYIQWSNGTPVFLLSDTAWLLPGRYSTSEVASHVASRVAQGFTAIQMTACFPEVQNGAPLQNINDIFTSGDLARPVASYWTAVDAKVKQCTDAGLIVILNPFWKKGSDAVLDSNGPAKCRAYGKWFATRYRNNPRVIYFVGGDDRPEPIRDEMNSMGLGIQDAYTEAGLPRAVVAYHGDPSQSSREAFSTETWVTLNWIYEYSPPLGSVGQVPYAAAHAEWPKTPAKPIMHGEGWYDRDNGATTSSRWANRFMLRRQAWWAVLGGGMAGYAYGAEPIWLHRYNNITPATAVNWESGRDAARLKTLLNGIEWWKMQPDIGNSFWTGSHGTFGDLNYGVSAVASDGSFAVAYTPVARSMTLVMPGSGRNFTLRWYDPSNATFRPGTTAASGATVTLTTPGNNASGQPDWVLLATSEVIVPPDDDAIQAESGVLSGGVTIDTNQPGYIGSGFLNFPATGGGAQYNNVNGGTGGSTTLTIRYANGSTAARTGRLVVNGAAQNITFGTTSGWGDWRDHQVTVPVTSGTTNTIRLESNGQDLGNIDQLTVGAVIVPPAGLADGTYKVINRNSLKAMDAEGNRTADGTRILQWTYGGGNNQRWIVQHRGNGEYSITGVTSSKAIEVIGSSTAPGTKLVLGAYTGAANEKFTITATNSGYYRVTPVHAPATALEVEAASATNGALLQLGTHTGANHQQWSFTAP